ncbi:uncharacterized protein LOC109863832 isoform X2 [Pseudomyrmex gracilis]|uniref:uncharacterized protein LOC109863832 isoform X2 n=1 Tax=Pseudomyrmex gracilis TaxID=219809 RepID=UPI000995716B|nr:uncharacterized protein LOC109863832 isoform X2 [Pseudomyrmex gracilis]
MRPTAARSNRSSFLHHSRPSPIPAPSTTSVCHQQQQQQMLYAPISNLMMTLQPCGTALHSSCVYPSVQPHLALPNSVPLHYHQGKNNRWHSKNKLSRNQQYCQQQQQQQQLSYNSKPMRFFDQQPSSSVAPSISPSATSFLVASSTFAHAGPLPSEHYNNSSGITHMLPQSFKSPDVQSFCFVQDRQNAQQQQQLPMQASYYNISATNTCSLQTVNANSSFPLSNLAPYTNLTTFSSNNQFPTQSSPLFSNTPVNFVVGSTCTDKSAPLPTLEMLPFKQNVNKISSVCESRIAPISNNLENSNDWPSQIEASSKNSYDALIAGNNKITESTDCVLQKPVSVPTKIDEEHYSDESSASFDFTIEAEKMVSALCNTTSSNDLGKEESKPANKTDTAPLFSGAGDNMPSNKTSSWFTDLCPEYENGMSIGVQTDSSCIDRSQYPELIRKTAYWGCTEAETLLACDGTHADSKRSWLTCLSSATRTAITKSSTCIPVFAGDQVFTSDLVNALLRISNGWLSLDNYLNKQHFPNLLDRLDPELIVCFHTWEENTCELLKQIVKTFQKFGENTEATDQKRNATCESSSFPGDVSLYTNCDLFFQLPSFSSQQNAVGKSSAQENARGATSAPLSTSSLRNFQYNSGQQESKLRSKWTITENLSSAINTTKSVPNVSTCHTDVGGLTGSKLRTKDASSFRKVDSTHKSLNAEFCQLRNKVMESNADATKDRRHNYTSENKLSSSALNNTESIRLQHSAVNTPVNYSGLYAENCLSFTFPLSGNPESSYSASNPGVLTYGRSGYSPSVSYPTADVNSRSKRNCEQTCGSAKSANSTIYRPHTIDHVELPAVPRNKVTLLSQIEPRTFDKESEEMAANLSAWFASMRNTQLPATVVPTFDEPIMNDNSAPRLFIQQDVPKYSSLGVSKQIDANRQFQALQNLPNIQSTPWVADNFVGNRFQTQQQQQIPEEYDSSEDVRVYMKPGSYNVPKKRHQRRPNRRSDNNATSRNNYHSTCGNKGKNIPIPASLTPLSHNEPITNIGNATLIKTSFPPASQLPTPMFNLENSPRILKRVESQDTRQDVTWKAACASAEILLEALNVKDCVNKTSKTINCSDSAEKDDKIENVNKTLPTTLQDDSIKHENVDCATSYEASEDDSGSTSRLSPSTSVISMSQSREDENALSIRTNVKTDSWLIRTLNNASVVSKRCKDDADGRSSESSNSSETADVKPDRLASSLITDEDTRTSTTTIVDSEYPAILSRKRVSNLFAKSGGETPTKESERYVGRATYSETVRRSVKSNNTHSDRKESCKYTTGLSMATVMPIPGRKNPRKDSEYSYQLLQKSRKSTDRKAARITDGSDVQVDEGPSAKISSGVRPNSVTLKTATKTHGKKKDLEAAESKCAGKSGDRGWSVWYSSRKKQSLSPLALSKLETIHQTVWQMDEAKIFRYPLSRENKERPSAEITEDYCKLVKNPMFLEIVEYKLKNRIYHKVEQAVIDFRRIIHNARLCHQHDDERTRKIEVLSKRLEDLLEEHFGNWNLDGVTPREDSPVQLRFTTTGQKLIAGHCDGTKKSTENSPLH